jgi:hypothetical protein
MQVVSRESQHLENANSSVSLQGEIGRLFPNESGESVAFELLRVAAAFAEADSMNRLYDKNLEALNTFKEKTKDDSRVSHTSFVASIILCKAFHLGGATPVITAIGWYLPSISWGIKRAGYSISQLGIARKCDELLESATNIRDEFSERFNFNAKKAGLSEDFPLHLAMHLIKHYFQEAPAITCDISLLDGLKHSYVKEEPDFNLLQRERVAMLLKSRMWDSYEDAKLPLLASSVLFLDSNGKKYDRAMQEELINIQDKISGVISYGKLVLDGFY